MSEINHQFPEIKRDANGVIDHNYYRHKACRLRSGFWHKLLGKASLSAVSRSDHQADSESCQKDLNKISEVY